VSDPVPHLLARHSSLTRSAPGVHERTTDTTFEGFRSLFGGYALALALAAMDAEVAATTGVDEAPRTVRALTMHFLRPFSPGAFRAEVTLDRVGRTVSTLSARLSTEGRLCGLAVATYATDRPAPEFTDAAMPTVAPVGADEEPAAVTMRVPAHDHYHFWPRHATPARARDASADRGPDRGPGGGPGFMGGWIVPHVPEPVTAGLLCAYGDIWIPVVHHRLAVPSISMTSDFTAHFRHPLPAADVDPASPILVSMSTRAAVNGFVDEDTEIWTADGRLLASTRQLRVLQAVE
jgi:acyl-coenzyme A thioesterase PaaI-like protein